MKTPEQLSARAREIRDGTLMHIKDALRVAQIEDVREDVEMAAFGVAHGNTYTPAEVLALLERVAKLLR